MPGSPGKRYAVDVWHTSRMLSGLRLIQPVLNKPFHRDGYVYEEKYDGWRMLAYKDGMRRSGRRGRR